MNKEQFKQEYEDCKGDIDKIVSLFDFFDNKDIEPFVFEGNNVVGWQNASMSLMIVIIKDKREIILVNGNQKMTCDNLKWSDNIFYIMTHNRGK